MLSVYVHWPFCKSKCPYCDFNSHVRESVDLDGFINAYITEIKYYKEILLNKTIKSIYFGGGTPSLAPPNFFEKVLENLLKYATFTKNIEITLEANPTSVESNKFYDYSLTGINRVSIGVQSFNNTHLKFLGREHSADEAKEAILYASKYFNRYSFDLIYALPGQTLREWEDQLNDAIKYSNNHMSLYQLTIEKGTQFYSDYNKRKFIMPEQELAADFYQVTQEIMEKHNLPAYEISNHASKGFESIHNMNYWQYGDYIGIGAGAHGRCCFNSNKYATVNVHIPEKWMSLLNDKGHALQRSYILTKDEQREEKIMMGLRLNKGISKDLISCNNPNYNYFLENEYLKEDQNNIIATPKGKLVLNYLISKLL